MDKVLINNPQMFVTADHEDDMLVSQLRIQSPVDSNRGRPNVTVIPFHESIVIVTEDCEFIPTTHNGRPAMMFSRRQTKR